MRLFKPTILCIFFALGGGCGGETQPSNDNVAHWFAELLETCETDYSNAPCYCGDSSLTFATLYNCSSYSLSQRLAACASQQPCEGMGTDCRNNNELCEDCIYSVLGSGRTAATCWPWNPDLLLCGACSCTCGISK